MLDAKIIERAFERTGKSKGGLARILDVRPGAISEILSGIRLINANVSAEKSYAELYRAFRARFPGRKPVFYRNRALGQESRRSLR